jgi:hypothetical protein
MSAINFIIPDVSQISLSEYSMFDPNAVADITSPFSGDLAPQRWVVDLFSLF